MDENDIGLFGPPVSPCRIQKKRKNQLETTPELIKTPSQPRPAKKKARRESSSGSTLVVRNKQVAADQFVEAGSMISSVPFKMEGMVANLGHMVKMLERVKGLKKGLMSDPVMACFMSAQTVVMACTAELISRSSERPQQLQIEDSSTNTADTNSESKN